MADMAGLDAFQDMWSFGDLSAFLNASAGTDEPFAKRQKLEATAPPQEALPRFGLVKMKMCTFFIEGRCTKGTSCTFAHGEHEIGQPYENQKPATGVTPSPGDISAQMAELQQLSSMLTPDDPLSAELQDLMQQAAASGLQQQPQQQRVFMKTKLCTFHDAGGCPRGDRCSFAHGNDQLGTPQPEGSFRPQSPVQGAATGVRLKLQLCVHWQSGSCSRGAACWFAHGENELGTPSPATGSAPSVASGMPGTSPGPSQTVKTKLCNLFTSGLCTRGENCWFAHGDHELGSPITPGSGFQLKKVKLCVNHEAGFCSYGDRCTFAHGEAQLGQPQNLAPAAAAPPVVVAPFMNSKGVGKTDFKGMGVSKGDGKGKGDGKPAPGCTAFVYFCPRDWDEETLKRHFMHCGAIKDVVILRDQQSGTSKGAGSVTFFNSRSVMKAIFSMNNFVAAPKCYLSVTVKKGEESFVPPQPDIPGLEFPRPGNVVSGPVGGDVDQGCTIYVKYIPPEWSDVDVYYAFNHYGQISYVSDPEGSGKSIVSFVEPLSAMRAMKGMNGFNAGSKCFLEVVAQPGDEHLFADVMELLRDIPDHVHAARGNPTKVPPGANLYVAGFPADWTEEDMHREFAGFGHIVCLRVQRHPDGSPAKYGFVGFKEPEMAQAAMSQLNGLQYDGGVLTVNIKEMPKPAFPSS